MTARPRHSHQTQTKPPNTDKYTVYSPEIPPPYTHHNQTQTRGASPFNHIKKIIYIYLYVFGKLVNEIKDLGHKSTVCAWSVFRVGVCA